MAGRINGNFFQPVTDLTPQRIDLLYGFNDVAPKINGYGPILFVGRKNFHPIPSHPKRSPVKIDVISFIQNIHQFG